jgi:hypothetical protein
VGRSMRDLREATWMKSISAARLARRRRTRRALSRHLPAAFGRPEPPNCLSEQELLELADRLDFDRIARLFPHRGDVGTLSHVAWSGSAVAGLWTTHADPELVSLGGTLNLVFALADSLLDESHSGANCSIDVANLRSLRFVLTQLGEPPQSVPSSCEHMDAVEALFGSFVRSLRMRLKAHPDRLDRIEELIRDIHGSAVGIDRQWIEAKTLPVLLLAELDNTTSDPRRTIVGLCLGNVIRLLDDWDDVAEDRACGTANSFDCLLRWRCLSHRSRSALSDGWVRTTRYSISRRMALAQSIEDLAAAAESESQFVRGRLHWVLAGLLGDLPPLTSGALHLSRAGGVAPCLGPS